MLPLRYVFRAIRPDEKYASDDGLHPKGEHASYSVSDAIEYNLNDQFVHTTKNPYVALYY